ncbi:hypothetical protein SteCoe_26271 [Stentor coeruleus]|uniref:RRM domain-containing protein n=1 Tax=Stentor coeruleus TaxID=5963 RepID=A0A1R2BD97_9CILI|nr:hypothetical protein SteCoe_26271 [Stentor coeruleus]
MDISRETKSKIKAYMEQQGISPNTKSLEIKCSQSSIIPQQHLQKLFENFGVIEQIDYKDKTFTYILTYKHASDAMLAKISLEGASIDDIGYEFSLSFVENEESNRVFEFMPTPEVFIPIARKNSIISKAELPESLKYIAWFPISMEDSENFHLKEKLLGAKGCNFRKIVEICAKDFVVPERSKDLIKLKIINEPEFSIKLTSRYCQKFQTACGLIYELITVVFEEYKRYCEIQGLNPSSLRVRKLEQVRGRARVFQERHEDPSIYSILEQ